MPKKKSTKLPFTVMSDKTCNFSSCEKKIKQNLVNRKPEQKSFLCFKHWMKKIGADRIKKWQAMQNELAKK